MIARCVEPDQMQPVALNHEIERRNVTGLDASGGNDLLGSIPTRNPGPWAAVNPEEQNRDDNEEPSRPAPTREGP